MRLSEELQERYFLSDRGVKVLGRGIFWTAVVNLIDMFGIAFLFLLADRLIGRLTDAGPAELPGPVPILPLLALYLLVSLLAHMLQYRATYTAVTMEIPNSPIPSFWGFPFFGGSAEYHVPSSYEGRPNRRAFAGERPMVRLFLSSSRRGIIPMRN